MGMNLNWQGHEIACDDQGYLRNLTDWQPALAHVLAQRDAVVLEAAHWQVIDYLRDYYRDYETAPPMRLMVKALSERYGAQFANSRMLYRLFPDGPVKQASRYAGLPRPVNCI